MSDRHNNLILKRISLTFKNEFRFRRRFKSKRDDVKAIACTLKELQGRRSHGVIVFV